MVMRNEPRVETRMTLILLDKTGAAVALLTSKIPADAGRTKQFASNLGGVHSSADLFYKTGVQG